MGFHATNGTYTYYCQLDDILVEEGALLAAPDSVTELVCTPDANGALSATVSFVLPTKTLGGADLQSLDNVEVSVNGQDPISIESPEPGKRQTLTVETVSGNNTIAVTAYNETGQSPTATATVYTGIDTPLPPISVKATRKGQQSIVTWTPTTTGIHGGHVDNAKTTYTIARWMHEYGRYDVIAKGITDTVFTENYVGGSQQDFIAYYVYANSTSENGTEYTASNNLVVGGEDVALPYLESFPNGNEAGGCLWMANSKNGMWAAAAYDEYWDDVEPQDEDGGFAYFEPMKADNASSFFESGRISVKGCSLPELTFWYYQWSSKNTIDVQINPDQQGWQSVKTIDFATGGSEGWQKVTVDLSQFASSEYIRIGLQAQGNDLAMLYIDNITVADASAQNLSARFASTPWNIRADKTNTFKVEIGNCGKATADEYKVVLLRDGAVVDSKECASLGSLATTTVELCDNIDLNAAESLTYQAVVCMEGDQNALNDSTAKVTLKTVLPTPAPVNDLAGSLNGQGVQLDWTTPNVNGWEPVTEDFESYPAFTISDFGQWQMQDVNGGQATYGIQQTSELLVEYPNYGSAMAYQVFNPSLAAISASNWQPHNGKQMLAAFCDYDDANDDWLISPELSGHAQTLSFFAASASYYYGDETFEVWASETDSAMSSFEKIYEGSVPMQWTNVAVELPEGTRFFAIRHTMADGFCFLLDDITYTPSTGGASLLTLQGYNVYRDGQLLNAEPLTTTSYADTEAQEGQDHIYNVTAVYAQGESAASSFSLSATAIDTIAADGKLSVSTQPGRLVLTSKACAQDATIVSAAGQLIWKGSVDGQATISATSGTYIVAADGQTRKVLIP